MHKLTTPLTRLLLLAALLGSAIQPASSQTIRGRLLDAETKTPIPFGGVSLLDTAFIEIGKTTTNSAGSFQIEVPRPGLYFLLAEAIGYRRTLDGVLELGEGGEISVDFFLAPQPIELDSLAVDVERRRINRNLEMQGFFDRQESGFGHFITPSETEGGNFRELRSMLRKFPNLRFFGVGSGRTMLKVRYMGRECAPAVYVDGALVDLNWENASPYDLTWQGLEQVVAIGDIASVEYYDGPAGLPLRWGGTSLGNTCGVIVFWTVGGTPD